nr:copper chaperone for superoxide dismutase isoform X5 [Bubalus bubalis]
MTSPKASCANMLILIVPTPFPVVSHACLPVNLLMENRAPGHCLPSAPRVLHGSSQHHFHRGHPKCGGAVGEPDGPGADHPAQPGGAGPSRRHWEAGGPQGHGQWPVACGDHFNPDGMSHGGPQDSERPGEGDTQNSVVAAQPEHLCRSLQEALGTQSKLQIQSEGHRLWERASQRRPRWVLARDLSPVPHEPFPRAAHGTAAACPQSQREKASKTPATLLLKPQLGGDAWSSPHSAAPRRPGECPC